MSQSRLPTAKEAGEDVEHLVIERLDALEPVPDVDCRWHDAETTTLLEPAADTRLAFAGINLVGVETPVEIKAAQRRLNSGARGRWYIRQRQHERLVEAAGVYVLVVYDPRPPRSLLAMAVAAATTVDELLPHGWTAVEADRSEVGYRQLTWSNVLDPEGLE